MDTVCIISTISLQHNLLDPGVLAKESSKDPIVSSVMRYTGRLATKRGIGRRLDIGDFS